MIILFVNCSLFPFIEWILSGLKTYETRNRNTLKSLINKKVYLAATGKGKRPIVYGYCIITDVIKVTNKRTYNRYRKQTKIEKASRFDWQSDTKQKYLYKLENVSRCSPFPLPDNVKRHGRIYCEVID